MEADKPWRFVQVGTVGTNSIAARGSTEDGSREGSGLHEKPDKGTGCVTPLIQRPQWATMMEEQRAGWSGKGTPLRGTRSTLDLDPGGMFVKLRQSGYLMCVHFM